jgi:hypothetical protein
VIVAQNKSSIVATQRIFCNHQPGIAYAGTLANGAQSTPARVQGYFDLA